MQTTGRKLNIGRKKKSGRVDFTWKPSARRSETTEDRREARVLGKGKELKWTFIRNRGE